jgi:hypothetical protein
MPTIVCKERIIGEEPLETGDGTDPHLTFVEEVKTYDDGVERANKLTHQTGRTHKAFSYP